MKLAPASLVLALALATAPARAQVVGETPTVAFPDPARFARGPFAEGDLGAVLYLGKIGRFADPGPAASIRLGWDLLRWFAVQAYVGATISGSSPAPPLLGQSFQMYWYALEARLTLQLRRVGLFLAAGAGGLNMSSNLFDQPETERLALGHRVTFVVLGGGGVDLHTYNRHFSVGIAADYMWMMQFASSHALSLAAYIRYTR